MGRAVNAGILGMSKQFRYIVFTDALLQALPLESIKAILSHEIGHSQYKHLLFYPFILAGMLLTASPLSHYMAETISPLFRIPLDIWRPLLFYSTFILFSALYFRFLFGHFSKLFERQADLHIFALNILPENLISALHATARSEADRKKPNWHHYSIEERIEFIQSAANNPWLISRHHRKVKAHLALLFLLLAGVVGIIA